MPNPVLTRLLSQRDEQVQFINKLLEQVETENRDLVDAERSNLDASKQRIAELDKQIEPLEEFDTISAAHRAAKPAAPRPEGEDRSTGEGEQRLTITDRPMKYPTVGHFIVDKIRAAGYPAANVLPDADAQHRVLAAVQTRANEVTGDTPGLLPEPIVGNINTDLDGSRPFVSSVGAKPLPNGSGKTFSRPIVTQHTQSGEQETELAGLTSRKFTVGGVDFTRRTFGSTLTVSRQDIDWTSPSAWSALMSDFVLEYGADTEDVYAAEFGTGVTQTTAAATDDVQGWVKAIYAGAQVCATAAGTKRASALRLPNHIWCSVDMWASLGGIIDAARATQAASKSPGDNSPTAFAGDILGITRTMAPGLAAGTMIIGRSGSYEFYEERLGLLQAIVPSQLGVEVAYGGYAAANFLDATAFCKITAPAEG